MNRSECKRKESAKKVYVKICMTCGGKGFNDMIDHGSNKIIRVVCDYCNGTGKIKYTL
jgi:DnaJ-class molecular chaperone